jgi:hypothetical protein
MNTEAQSAHAAKNIGLVLQKKEPLPYAIATKGKIFLSSVDCLGRIEADLV